MRSPALRKVVIASVFLLTLARSGLLADEPSKKEDKSLRYHSETSFSLVLVKGNNNNLSYSFDTEQNLDIKRNRLSLKGRFINSRSNGEKTSEIYYSHLKYDRRIKSRAYLLGFIRYERNKLAGYNFRMAVSVGGGATWIKRNKVELFSEAAMGWNNEINLKRTSLNSVPKDASLWKKTITTSFISSIFNSKMLYTLSPSAQFVLQETVFLNAEDLNDYRLNSYASVSAAISPQLALKTSLQVIYEHQPVPGFKSTDYFLLSSLVIKI